MMIRLKTNAFMGAGEAYHAGASVFEKGVDLQVHTHDFHEVFWIASGSGIHRCNTKAIPVGPGYLAFIEPNDAHGVEAGDDRLFLRNIAFTKRAASLVWSSLQEQEEALQIFRSGSLAGDTQISPVLLRHLNAVFDEMVVLPRTSVRLHAFLFDLINRLLTEPESGTEAINPPAWLVRGVESFNKAAILEQGLAGFYKTCGRCQEHVARECRKYYNQTPSQLLNRHRLARAASLLTTTDETIVGISMDCGWNHLGHFYDLFHKAYGVTPKQFRQTARHTLPCSD